MKHKTKKGWKTLKKGQKKHIGNVKKCKFIKRREVMRQKQYLKDSLWEFSRTDENHLVTNSISTMNTKQSKYK